MSHFKIDFGDMSRRLNQTRYGSPGEKDGGYHPVVSHDVANELAASPKVAGKMSAQEAHRICLQTVLSTQALKTSVSAKQLESTLNRRLRAYLSKPELPYVLASSLATTPFIGQGILRSGRRTITISRFLPKRFDRRILEEPHNKSHVINDGGFPKIRLHIRARTPEAAFWNGIDYLDYFRGVWNFHLNRRIVLQWGGEHDRPLNRVLPGPVQTVHHANGKAAMDEIGYEPFFKKPMLGSSSGVKTATIRPVWASVSDAVRRSSYGSDIQMALVRYCRALDHRDPQLAFLKLWGVIELLTGTTEGHGDQAIKRTLALCPDPDLERYPLKLLRFHRNRSAHAHTDSIGRENLTRLHGYAHTLLRFTLGRARFFSCLEEQGEFLGLPGDRDLLKRKQVLSSAAADMRLPIQWP